tara:strand:+ start:4002 stop:4310 length:309 start_codon:yes stop_codon:yes gene_type:complete
MCEIIQFSQYRTDSNAIANDDIALSKIDVHKVEHIRDSIETALEKVANLEKMPLTVAMAAGRYAAMRMFQIQGRAETMAFLDECVVTAELCDDLMQHLDEDA